MPDFNVRADSVNVEQIMEQIRARIREKRGVDYTEEQIRALATVKLEKFLDPRSVRSDLLEQYRHAQPPPEAPALPRYTFGDETLFESHRAPVRWIRRLLLPLLKLFFNPNPLIQALHIQAQLNAMHAEREARRDAVRHGVEQLYYEVMHNLVVEMTKTAIEVKNLKMRVESLTGRLEFNERRARALESAAVYRPAEPVEEVAAAEPEAAVPGGGAARPAGPEGPGQKSRRRRRRRGRRSSTPASVVMGEGGAESPSGDDGQEADGDVGPDADMSRAEPSASSDPRPEPDEP